MENEANKTIEEKIFLKEDDVLVSDKRVVLDNKTYALKQITAVERVEYRTGPRMIFNISIGKVFIRWIQLSFVTLFAYWGVWLMFNISKQANLPPLPQGAPPPPPPPPEPMELWPFQIALYGTLIMCALLFLSVKKNQSWVEITSASGKEKAMLCDSKEYAQEVTDAINKAIISN